ncbi:MAG TPA: hypothetical protein VF843_16920 [Streptosporangiaceae bacterium]
MLNQVLESTLAVMVALLALSISVIVRVRPTTPATPLNSEHEVAAEPMFPGNGFSSAGLAGPGSGPTLWAASPPGSLPALGSAPRSRPGLPGRRYEPRHVRGRVTDPGQPGPSGPPWGPAPPPASRSQQGSERWS